MKYFAFFFSFSINLTAASAQFFEEDNLVNDKTGSRGIVVLGPNLNSIDGQCDGEILKINQEEAKIAPRHARAARRKLRLPTCSSRRALICEDCAPPKINKKYFPNVSAEVC